MCLIISGHATIHRLPQRWLEGRRKDLPGKGKLQISWVGLEQVKGQKQLGGVREKDGESPRRDDCHWGALGVDVET